MELVCLIHTFLHSVRCCMLALLALCYLFGFLCFFCIFVCLPTCSCMSLCVIHTPIQWNYKHSIQTYICPPKTPPFCLITHLFAFHVLHIFVCPCLASFAILSLACFSLHLFLCLSTGLFLLSLHVDIWSEHAWSKGVTS